MIEPTIFIKIKLKNLKMTNKDYLMIHFIHLMMIKKMKKKKLHFLEINMQQQNLKIYRVRLIKLRQFLN